ncbi:MAG: hypothetical protein KKB82_03865 [Candidatus Omnitrophica bacterium]|nr:hypothetical protein [Candidatus Omnitrophota bacterium]MBU1925041.1 hypothetical protein [Candidatus Omnitrophota bacterium]
MSKKTVIERVNEKIEKGFQTSCIVCSRMKGVKLVGHTQGENGNFIGFIFSCRKCFAKIIGKKLKLLDNNQMSSLTHNKEHLAKSLASLKEQNEKMKQEIGHLKTVKKRAEENVARLKDERSALLVQVDDKQSSPQELKKLEADNKLLQDKLWQSEKDQEQALEKIVEFKKEHKILEMKIGNLESNQKHSLELLGESELLQKQVFKLQGEQRGLLQKIAVLEKERQELVSNNFGAKEMEIKYAKQLNELRAEKEVLLDNLQKLEKAEMTDWTLDVDKLNELKEFTLKSIEVRPGKNTHFVNGAFEAVGLLYRSILNDKPIKKEY